MKRSRLGDVLKRFGAISDAQLDQLMEEQQETSLPLGELMLQKGLVSKNELGAALQEVTRVTYVNCLTADVDPQAAHLVSRETAIRYCCLPIAIQGGVLTIVMAEPQNLQFRDDLRFLTGLEISPRLGFQADIRAAIEKYLPENGEGLHSFETPTAVLPSDGLPDMEFFTLSSQQRAKDAIQEFQAELRKQPTAAVRLVSLMIATAERKKASDIHIEPTATETQVRMRVDGMLREVMQVSQALSSHLVSRIKILADMDIAERRTPQDGRFGVRIERKKFDLRVSSLPTHYGEKVVIRVLDPDSARVSFADLGMPADAVQAFTRILRVPRGLVLVCGPTGSGKTTTLYAALNLLSTRSVNIVSIEDPIEYMLKGINQVQVNSKVGLTFASYLRSILRQDPNIIMVGEIRDKETAEIAMTAAQTGHLILSTIHTNDSVGALDRLRDLGIAPFMIASSVTGILGQRLLRKLCSCRMEGKIAPSYLARVQDWNIATRGEKTFLPVGCDACDHTGYSGRIGVFELLVMDDDVRAGIQNDAKLEEIRDILAANGMRSMTDAAFEYARVGVTSLDEVFRVVPLRERGAAHCQNCGRHLTFTFLFCPACGKKVSENRNGATDRPVLHLSAGREPK